MIGATFSTKILDGRSANDIFNETKDRRIYKDIISLFMIDEYIDDEGKEYLDTLETEEQIEFIFNYVVSDVSDDKVGKLLNEIYSITSDIPIVDRFKKCLNTLNEYVEVGIKEVKKYGEVFTPLSLVKDMLDTLPSEVWSNPDLKWLDPCSGMGNFPLIVIKKLMVGLKDWEKDSEKRYKHIIENMIYVGELQPRNAFMYLFMVDPLNKYDINLYCGSFLEDSFNNHMRDVWGVDKFDISVANPPYLKNIHLDFLVKSNDISNNSLFIHPSGWLFRNGKKEIGVKDSIGNKIKSVNLLNGNYYFNGAEFGAPLTITYLSDKDTEYIKLIYDTTGNIYDTKYLPSGFWEPSDIMLNLKVKFSNLCEDLGSLNDILIKNTDDCKFIVSAPRVCGHAVKRGDKSVFTTNDFYTYFYKKSNLNDSKTKNKVFCVNSELERENLINYMKTKIARFGLYINKISQDSHIKRYIENTPLLDFTKKWDDSSLIEKLKMTKKEWEFINSVIPDYYDDMIK